MQLQKSTVVFAGSVVVGYVAPSRWIEDADGTRCEAYRLRPDRTNISLGRFATLSDATNAIMAAELGRRGPEPLPFVDVE